MFPNKLYIANNYLFKVNNRNTRTSCEICSKVTKKTPEQRHVVLLSSLLNLNKFHTLFQCFYCWLWAGTCLLGSNVSKSSHFEVFFKIGALGKWAKSSKNALEGVFFFFLNKFLFLFLSNLQRQLLNSKKKWNVLQETNKKTNKTKQKVSTKITCINMSTLFY